MPTTFTYVPSYSSALQWKPTIRKVVFGDGYEQSIPEALNNDRMFFTLYFIKIKSSEAAAIVAFIKATNGTAPFYWSPPAPYNVGAPFLFKCETYDHAFVESNAETLTLPFIQTFNPT